MAAPRRPGRLQHERQSGAQRRPAVSRLHQVGTFRQHVLCVPSRMGYHDGRTGLTKTDNRALAVRASDHKNIRIGTYGGDSLAIAPAGPASVDLLSGGAAERPTGARSITARRPAARRRRLPIRTGPNTPWLRGGWFRSSGDNANRGEHKPSSRSCQRPASTRTSLSTT